jgi:carbon-monoxide dehydrogenase medium subunit
VTFEYLEAGGVDDAVAALAGGDADTVALAGGTAFTLLLRQGLIRPSLVIGLRRVAAMRGIRADGDGLWIGALSTHREVETSPLVRARHPALAAAFGTIATIRIRNQATLGGNLAHADPAQDPPPILIALDASVLLAGPGGARREVPVERFFTDFLSTVLEPGELILGVRIPAGDPATRTTYRKFLPRSAEGYATVSVAASARLDARGRIAALRIALGGVGPTPVRAVATEAALIGALPDPASVSAAAALVKDALEPLDDLRGSASYKREMAAVWIRRAVLEVTL